MVELNVSCVSGEVKSLKHNGKEKLSSAVPLSRIYLSDGTVKNPLSIAPLKAGEYKIRYAGIETEVILGINATKKDYITFEILKVINPDARINEIDIFAMNPSNVPFTNRDFALNSGSDELFLNFLPLEVETVCGLLEGAYYGCKASKWMGFENRRGALLTATKANYWDAFKQLIADYHLPNVVLGDGKWFRESGKMRESYLFVTITENNYRQLLDYGKRGNFKQLLVFKPLIPGSYGTPSAFGGSMSDFKNALQSFVDNGIKVGIHGHFNRIDERDSLFHPVNQSLFKKGIGKLGAGISDTAGAFTLTNANRELLSSPGYFSGWAYHLIIDNELIQCNSYANNQFLGCSRGLHTTKVPHVSGAEVYLVPNHVGFFINPDNERIKQSSIDSYARLANDLKVNLIYSDGTAFPGEPGMKDDVKSSYAIKMGLLPYLNSFKTFPLVQNGEDLSGFAWHYSGREASWDGVNFKNKEFTKKFKTKLVAPNNPYALGQKEFGWWNVFGSGLIGETTDDNAAITYDEVHYVMTKALTMEAPLGLLVDESFEKHAFKHTIFDLFGKYQSLINEDFNTGFVPQKIKDHLKRPEKEAEISNVSGWNLIEKKLDNQYAVWNNTSNYGYTLDNPFGDQKLKVEIRPRFDYHPYDDARHLKLVDFSDAASLISSSHPQVTCSINQDGVLSISTGLDTKGYCKIRIPGSFNLGGKRGIGISVTGDGNDEEVVLRLASGQFGKRDFGAKVDFNGQKNVVLGDPLIVISDVGGDLDSPLRHWGFEYTSLDQIELYVFVKPRNPREQKTVYSVQLHSLKALQEKGQSKLVTPVLEVNGRTITFPVNISAMGSGPHLIEYNGYTREYNAYSPNYELISFGKIPGDNIVVSKGANRISVSSDTSNPEYASRADVIISVHNDEDNDGVPTNGNYDESFVPCTGRNNFCDDSYPNVSPPLDPSKLTITSGEGSFPTSAIDTQAVGLSYVRVQAAQGMPFLLAPPGKGKVQIREFYFITDSKPAGQGKKGMIFYRDPQTSNFVAYADPLSYAVDASTISNVVDYEYTPGHRVPMWFYSEHVTPSESESVYRALQVRQSDLASDGKVYVAKISNGDSATPTVGSLELVQQA